MPSETFFTTTAQVLPALLIAFTVEAAALLRDPLNGWRRRIRQRNLRMYKSVVEHPNWLQFERWQRQLEDGEVGQLRDMTAMAAYGFLAMVVIGEVSSTWVLYLGIHNTWFVGLAGAVCAGTMTFSAVVVAAMPIARISLETDRPLPKIGFPRLIRVTVRVERSWKRPVGVDQ